MRKRSVLPLILLFTFVAATLHADDAVFAIHVRTNPTGHGTKANVTLKGAKTFSAVTDGFGNLRLQVPADAYEVTISAPGFKSVTWRKNVASLKDPEQTALLFYEEWPANLRAAIAKARIGSALILGYANDAEGRPVAGVRVRAENAKVEAYTDDDGLYTILIPLPQNYDPNRPLTETVIGAKRGYKTLIHRNVLLVSGSYSGVGMDMKRGTGEENFDDAPCPLRKEGCATDSDDEQ